ncbi:MAG: tRNA (N6-threonylcarbamoyladenosine(37)-N6)-methyltransferase TrmO [Clostridia bacterium]|nr:tRNA (N6-threonylcarbamoyladenosine(37)-N6)-methyltransferase TrmO [Clostridia bacterium]
MKIIARIHTDFPEKFGIPRQSGILEMLESTVVFEPEYRNPDALRGIDGFSHLWLIWEFSESVTEKWSPTVRPPRLGGNARLGVFATRAPYRPNPIGLSSVKLLGVENTEENGTVLRISGADLMDGTPIYDIKPYLPYTDCHPDASGGFAEPLREYALDVVICDEMLEMIPEDKRGALVEILKNDPRPGYQRDPQRVYKMSFARHTVSFKVEGSVLAVTDISPLLQ